MSCNFDYISAVVLCLPRARVARHLSFASSDKQNRNSGAHYWQNKTHNGELSVLFSAPPTPRSIGLILLPFGGLSQLGDGAGFSVTSILCASTFQVPSLVICLDSAELPTESQLWFFGPQQTFQHSNRCQKISSRYSMLHLGNQRHTSHTLLHCAAPWGLCSMCTGGNSGSDPLGPVTGQRPASLPAYL